MACCARLSTVRSAIIARTIARLRPSPERFAEIRRSRLLPRPATPVPSPRGAAVRTRILRTRAGSKDAGRTRIACLGFAVITREFQRVRGLSRPRGQLVELPATALRVSIVREEKDNASRSIPNANQSPIATCRRARAPKNAKSAVARARMTRSAEPTVRASGTVLTALATTALTRVLEPRQRAKRFAATA